MKILITSVLLFLAIVNKPILAQEIPRLTYADHLFTKGKYSKAIEEYERHLFFNPINREDSLYAISQIIKSYYMSEDYKNTLSHIESNMVNIKDEHEYFYSLNNYAGMSYLKLGYPKSAIIYFNQNRNEPQSILLTGIAYIHLHQWNSALKTFDSLLGCEDKAIAGLASKLSQVSKEGKTLKIKKPMIAGALSLFLPGAGYVYTEHYQTALSSLLLNSLLLGTSYELHKNGLKFTGSSAFILSFGWYIGNIYGSVKSAIRYNDLTQKIFIDESLQECTYFIKP